MTTTKTTKIFDGNATLCGNPMDGYRIDCRLNLWCVSGGDIISVMTEAGHYYRQYKADGEYDGTVVDKIRQQMEDK